VCDGKCEVHSKRLAVAAFLSFPLFHHLVFFGRVSVICLSSLTLGLPITSNFVPPFVNSWLSSQTRPPPRRIWFFSPFPRNEITLFPSVLQSATPNCIPPLFFVVLSRDVKRGIVPAPHLFFFFPREGTGPPPLPPGSFGHLQEFGAFSVSSPLRTPVVHRGTCFGTLFCHHS